MGQFDFDVIIIGGGSGGYAAARTLHGGGKKVAVIEGGKEVGGLCILRGCMPTKALLQAADVLHLARKSSVWGLRVTQAGFDFPAVMRRKQEMVREFASYRQQQLESGRFEFIRATAVFVDAHTVQLSTGQTCTAEHFVISTGSTVAPSPVPGLQEAGFIASDDALDLPQLPKSIIILGGGAIAVEFAQFFARFDVHVTLVQRSQQLLKEFDPDIAAELEKVFLREGVQLHTGCTLLQATRAGTHKRVTFLKAGQEMAAEADEIFFGLGRVGNIHSLHLENAGVRSQDSQIVATPEMRTSQPHIFAAGDCVGPHEIVHIAIQQGEIAAHNILHPERPRTIDYRLLLSVVFTDPQVASVGLTEKKAKEQGIPHLASTYPFNDHGKSMIMDAQEGIVKLLADPVSGKILGGSCTGPMGGELIHEIVAAMAGRMTVHQLAAMPHYHPTLAEIWTYPAEDLAEKITRS